MSANSCHPEPGRHKAVTVLLRLISIAFALLGVFMGVGIVQIFTTHFHAFLPLFCIEMGFFWLMKTFWSLSEHTPRPWVPFHHAQDNNTPPDVMAYVILLCAAPLPILVYYGLTSLHSYREFAIGTLTCGGMLALYGAAALREYRHRERVYYPDDPKLRKDVIGPYWWISEANSGAGWGMAYVVGWGFLGLSLFILFYSCRGHAPLGVFGLNAVVAIGGGVILRMGIVRREWERTHPLTEDNTRSSLYDRYRRH